MMIETTAVFVVDWTVDWENVNLKTGINASITVSLITVSLIIIHYYLILCVVINEYATTTVVYCCVLLYHFMCTHD